MSEEKGGFLTPEEVPSSIVAQAVTAFFSPFMISTPRELPIDALRKAPCVLVEDIPINFGEMLVEKLRRLGARVTSEQVIAKSDLFVVKNDKDWGLRWIHPFRQKLETKL
jgi:hypothetical protein